ncbi:MAG: RagB/SusD family nutrient uptake outer membrane protein, partial [Chlorobi bacterium]|nr:RagB/SusD family nutrient uptake outer membrane protein [Chlorobiota bacterium]
SVATDDLYNSKKGQEKLLVDIYSKFRNVYNTGELQYYGTDLYMAITESPDERMFNGYDASFNSTAGIIFPYWNNLYKIVQETNILLNRCNPDEEGMTTDDYNSIIAQGKFQRVLAYYYLVETFGPVPLLTEENATIITEVERTPEENIYEFMISELRSVEELLPWRSAEPGRISKAAIKSLLGKLYLTRAYRSYANSDDFNVASGLFDEIIFNSDNNYYLLDNYRDVFDEDNQNNGEIIWAIQYGEDKEFSGPGNPQQSLFGFNITALEPGLFIKNQEDYSFMERKYWIIPKVHELFTNPDLDSRYDATFQREFYVNNPESEYYGELGIFFPVWNDYSGNDNGALNYYPFQKDGEYVWYPQSTALEVLKNGSDRMPIIRKFKDTKMQWAGKGTREDVVFRLGDIYLLSAEAYLGADESIKALERLNTIRRRAGVEDFTDIDLNVILDERARELLGEHDRWFDLKRTGKLIERAYEYNIFVQKYDNLNTNHLVRPIPQDEIDRLTGLTQNPGY